MKYIHIRSTYCGHVYSSLRQHQDHFRKISSLCNLPISTLATRQSQRPPKTQNLSLFRHLTFSLAVIQSIKSDTSFNLSSSPSSFLLFSYKSFKSLSLSRHNTLLHYKRYTSIRWALPNKT